MWELHSMVKWGREKRQGASLLPPRTIDNTWERGYNKDKGNTVSRRLALVIG